MKMNNLAFITLCLSSFVKGFDYLKNGHIVWRDEFNGNELDETNWWYDLGPSNVPKQLQVWTKSKENLKVANGTLTITAVPKGIKVVNGVAQKSYTSAQINTRYKLDFKYGRFETRMKLTNVSGFSPAFFLYPTYEVYGPWPNSGQIIPLSMIGSQPGSITGGTYFGQYVNNNPPSAVQSYVPFGTTANTNNFGSSFHIYACEWDEYEIRLFVDDYMYFKQNIPSNGWKPAWYSIGYPQPAPFDQVFFLTFNLGVGGDWAGLPSSPYSQSIEIDYIRVWQNSTKNITAVPNRPPTNSDSSNGGTGFTTAALIAVIIVGVILVLTLIALRYLWAYIKRKRAESDAPLPDASVLEPGGEKFAPITKDSEIETMIEEGNVGVDETVAPPSAVESKNVMKTKSTGQPQKKFK